MLLPNVYRLGHSLGYGIQTWMKHPHMFSIVEQFENFDIWQLPVGYKDWWWNAATNDPIHVIVETSLLAFVVYLLILTRNKDYKNVEEQKLTQKEQDDLLEEWKTMGRASLAPSSLNTTTSSLFTVKKTSSSSNRNAAAIVASMNGRTMEIFVPSNSSEDDDCEKENTILNSSIISSVFQKNKSKKKSSKKTGSNTRTISTKASEEEDDDKSNSSSKSNRNSKEENLLPAGIQKQTVLNFATNDFLGFASSTQVKEASLAALKKYGCGSCGPRGFYGTIDVHLELEAQIAQYVGTEQAILYSDGASAVSSTIAAFCKRGDLIIVDEGVYEPMVTGITLSRANVIWFKHNDMDDLRRILEMVQQKDKQLGRAPNDQRRFIVVEGLYKNSGTVCPLDQLVALKHEFKYRLILDESHSFGTLAPKGCLDLYQRRYMYDAEIVTIGLETTLGGIGGVTVGNEEVVDHQRLSGAGYCFSASSPPFTASAAMASLSLFQQEPDRTQQLQSNVIYFHQQFCKSSTLCSQESSSQLVRTSHDQSPLIHLELVATSQQDTATDSNNNTTTTDITTDPLELLQQIANFCLTQGGVAVLASPRYHRSSEAPPPALCLIMSSCHTKEDIDKLIAVLEEACQSVLAV
mmetsp:Transcript_20508/g.31069  ORF Transcript_20508/g.31069 Transcript_20508/m.31069 type:complete len:634 (-) Transcript_20508:139-2040(-)|eukprot:CAMPEP_0194205566 /NCGR_PEP_ID=MMETSP0156-20130528/4809_1 /TAXON_ID=33649 /ORGANISM="Thalassionema nitzschioides, Strain L26-B" /LENGTH=633 /DNA_ID=CAMNT_0038931869 /DNA_START=192 /DNA_END=2096 /DNA_ORIENTATION=-